MFFAVVNLISYCRVKSGEHKTFGQTTNRNRTTGPVAGEKFANQSQNIS